MSLSPEALKLLLNQGTYTVTMPGQPLWPTVKAIIDAIRKLIVEKRAIQFKPDNMGWQYVGKDILREMGRLKTAIEANGYKVSEIMVSKRMLWLMDRYMILPCFTLL